MYPVCSVEGCERPVFVDKSGLCRLHYHRWRRGKELGNAERQRIDGTPEERWLHWAEPQENGCWVWNGQRDRHGYGILTVVEDGQRRSLMAHRWGYERFVGPVAKDLDLDHLCRNPSCVFPGHMDPVTHGENVRRGDGGAYNRDKQFCKNGHEFTPENTYIRPDNGYRQCKACSRADGAERTRRHRARKRAQNN